MKIEGHGKTGFFVKVNVNSVKRGRISGRTNSSQDINMYTLILYLGCFYLNSLDMLVLLCCLFPDITLENFVTYIAYHCIILCKNYLNSLLVRANPLFFLN